MSQQLESQLQQGSAEAAQTAKAMGGNALPILIQYSRNESDLSREAAMEGLAAVGGDQALQALVAGLDDESAGVRAIAAHLLRENATPGLIPALRTVLARTGDVAVRGAVALMLGRLNDTPSVAMLDKMLGTETDGDARKKMHLALAHLGEQRQIDEILTALQTHGVGTAYQDARVRYEAIADLEYLQDPRLLTHLLPLLDDREQVKNLGSEPYPLWHRVCDRAVDAIPVITGQALPFATGGRNYSESEVQQARMLISKGN